MIRQVCFTQTVNGPIAEKDSSDVQARGAKNEQLLTELRGNRRKEADFQVCSPTLHYDRHASATLACMKWRSRRRRVGRLNVNQAGQTRRQEKKGRRKREKKMTDRQTNRQTKILQPITSSSLWFRQLPIRRRQRAYHNHDLWRWDVLRQTAKIEERTNKDVESVQSN